MMTLSKSKKSDPKSIFAYFSVVYLAVGVALTFLGPKIARSCGADGRLYCDMAIRLPDLIRTSAISSFHSQRIFPFLSIRWLLLTLNIPLNDITVTKGLELWNLFFLFLSLWAAFLIAKRLCFTMGLTFLWMAGLYFNSANLTHAFFYPVLTDVTALSLSVCMIWAWVERHWLIWVISIVSWFTWPVAWPLSIILIAFRRPLVYSQPIVVTVYSPRRLALSSFLALGAVAILWFLHHSLLVSRPPTHYYTISEYPWLVPIAFIAAAFFITYINYSVLSALEKRKFLNEWDHYALIRGVVAVMTYFVLRRFVEVWLNVQYLGSIDPYWHTLAWQLALRPLFFLPSHLIYLGPLIIVYYFFFHRAMHSMVRLGKGAVLACGFATLLAFGAESRQQLFNYPWMCLAAVLSIRFLHRSRFFIGICLVLSVILARPGWIDPSSFHAYYLVHPVRAGFAPPWIPEWAYLAGMVLFGMGALVLWVLAKNTTGKIYNRTQKHFFRALLRLIFPLAISKART